MQLATDGLDGTKKIKNYFSILFDYYKSFWSQCCKTFSFVTDGQAK